MHPSKFTTNRAPMACAWGGLTERNTKIHIFEALLEHQVVFLYGYNRATRSFLMYWYCIVEISSVSDVRRAADVKPG